LLSIFNDDVKNLQYDQLNEILLFNVNDILIFSNFFYTDFYHLLILLGVILLTAMLGSIVLALSTMDDN
jgi:NADH:ubiquinone oxidoreductase subunit 6 (subunit J)